MNQQLFDMKKPKTTKRMVLGFLFNNEGTEVALIRKSRPAWMARLWNGLGGAIEEGESPIEAMIREFREEGGAATIAQDWSEYCVFSGPGYVVHVFVAKNSALLGLLRRSTNTIPLDGEPVAVFPRTELSGLWLVSNVAWLIPMGWEWRANRPRFAAKVKFEAAA